MAIQKLLKYLNDSGMRVEPRGTTGFYVDGQAINAKNAVKTVYAKLKGGLSEEQRKDVSEYVLESRDNEGQEFIDAIRAQRREAALEVKGEIIGKLDSRKSFKFLGLCPIRDIKTGARGLFDTHRDRISDLDFDTWLDKLPPDKDFRASVFNDEICGLIEYDPYTLESKKETKYEDQEIYKFNSHIPPAWRLSDLTEDIKVPDFFIALMEHLFPNEKCRDYVTNWLYALVYQRNETALLLQSNMGTGKGLLCEIAEALVGESNAQTQSEDFFRSQFNSEIENKRLVIFDETPLLRKYKERFKFLLNTHITIEKKGQSVEGTKRNHSSFIITNNFQGENQLVPRDRRFSVPNTTDIPLQDLYSEEEISDFKKAMASNPKVILGIAKYLEDNHDPDFNVYLPYKDKKFHELCFWSLREWQRFIIDKVAEGSHSEYDIGELKDNYEDVTGQRQWPGQKSISNFLDQWKDYEGDRLAHVEKRKNAYLIVPNDKYLKQPKTITEDFPDDFNL